jgi:signal transduction histidine kinase
MLSVEDNGYGFKASEVKGGLGLHNVRTRVQSLDGFLSFESKPGRGAIVIVEIEMQHIASGYDVNMNTDKPS